VILADQLYHGKRICGFGVLFGQKRFTAWGKGGVVKYELWIMNYGL